jgi:xanthine dehydrogenase small subunit
MENRNKIITTINSKRVEIDGEKAFMPLANYLREGACLTGTKVVCAEGDCGACTVLLARDVGADGKLKFNSFNSCIIPLYLIDGAQVVTIEGLKKSDTELHPVQESMVACHGAQCGYCTPGFICAMAGMVEDAKGEQKPITEKKAKNYLTGNLCRCTGYKPIIEAAVNIDLNKTELLKDRYHNPSWLNEMKKIKSTSMTMTFDNKSIFLPVKLDEALEAKNKDRDMRLIGGSTDIGVVVNKGKLTTPKAMALYHIDELKKISHDDKYISVGATVTLSEFERYVEKLIPELKQMLHIFASPQIKNQGTLVGNVVNASPIADTIPYLMASDARVVLKSVKGERDVLMPDFYLGYKKLDMDPSEIVIGIKIPLPKKSEQTRLYKVSVRRDLDISAVTFAGMIEVEKGTIKNARIAMGGVAATVLRLKEIESKLQGMDFNRKTFEEAAAMMPTLINPLSDLRASKEYRMLLAKNFFLKFHNDIAEAKV